MFSFRPRDFVLVIAAALLSWQLFIPPFTGMPDNGDFALVSGPFGLVPEREDDPDRYFKYIVTTYKRIAPLEWISKQITSERLVVVPPFLLNLVLSKDGTFDIRWMGLAHSLLFLTALWLLLPFYSKWSSARRVAMCALILTAFCDAMYVTFFNSFYTDAGSMLFLLLAVVLFLRLAAHTGDPDLQRPALYLCCALFVTSKSQHAVLGFLIAGFLIWQRKVFGKHLRGLAFGTASIVLPGALTLAVLPQQYRGMALYNAIFQNVLPNSPDAATALEELGLDPAWASYKGTDAYNDASGVRNKAFFDEYLRRVSPARVVLFYLRHPEITGRRLLQAFERGSKLRPGGFGNFAKSSGEPASTLSRSVDTWSRVKAAVFLGRPSLYLAYGLAPCAVVFLLWRRRYPLLAAGMLLLLAMATAELLLPALLDFAEDTRHLILFNWILDLMFVLSAGACLHASGSASLDNVTHDSHQLPAKAKPVLGKRAPLKLSVP